MKSHYIIISALVLLCAVTSSILRGEVSNILLSEIANDIDQYKTKTLTLMLKLKYHDTVFERLVFYDSKNHDIEFDISSKDTIKKIKDDLLNLHEGMDYYVTFTVTGRGNLGGVIARLDRFKPMILNKIPHNGE